MEKTYHLLNPQANPHFLDLVAREIFILVSSETGSWKRESDLKKESKIGVSGRPYCRAISEQRWCRHWETSKQPPWSHYSSRMNKPDEDPSFSHNHWKLMRCVSMDRARRGRGPPSLSSDWLSFLVLNAFSTREQCDCCSPEHLTLPCLLNISAVNSGVEKGSSSNRLASFSKSCLSKPCFVEIAFPYMQQSHIWPLSGPQDMSHSIVETQCSPCLTSFLPQESTEKSLETHWAKSLLILVQNTVSHHS